MEIVKDFAIEEERDTRHKQAIFLHHAINAVRDLHYDISGVIKKFIDRFTNLLYNHKELGKGLENKSLYVIASFTGEEPREGQDNDKECVLSKGGRPQREEKVTQKQV